MQSIVGKGGFREPGSWKSFVENSNPKSRLVDPAWIIHRAQQIEIFPENAKFLGKYYSNYVSITYTTLGFSAAMNKVMRLIERGMKLETPKTQAWLVKVWI